MSHVFFQVVAGMNYFVKVHTHPESGHHVHLRIYKDLKGGLSLHSLQVIQHYVSNS